MEVTGQGYYSEGSVTHNGKDTQLKLDSALWHMGVAAALLNTAEISYVPQLKIFQIKGDPTEAAMFVFAQKLGFDAQALRSGYETVFEIPFDPLLRYHAGFYRNALQASSNSILYLNGSPEQLFSMSLEATDSYQEALQALLAQGLRVVAVGMKEIPLADLNFDCSDKELCLERYKESVKDITILGLFGIQDSIRPEVQGVLAQARHSGIRVVMATGDHKSTALYVAKRVGLFKEGDHAIDGSEFRNLSDAELLAVLERTTVFSRVSPADKLRIIRLFHEINSPESPQDAHIVAMTGDGINDAPSLVAADLGIAMGGIGTEVAKQAADIVLLDDSFVSIMNGVEQGRHIFYSLRRVVLYFFATNMGEILIVLFAMFSSLPLPLTAPQILWLNLVTDGFLDVALSTEPKEKGLLEATWLQKKMRLIDLNLLLKVMFVAIPMGAVSLAVFTWDLSRDGLEHARTMALITMAMFQWFNAWNCRSEKLSILELSMKQTESKDTKKWLCKWLCLVPISNSLDIFKTLGILNASRRPGNFLVKCCI